MCSKDEDEKEADQHLGVQVLDLVFLVLVLGQPQWLPADLFDPSLFIQLSCIDWPKPCWWLEHEQSVWVVVVKSVLSVKTVPTCPIGQQRCRVADMPDRSFYIGLRLLLNSGFSVNLCHLNVLQASISFTVRLFWKQQFWTMGVFPQF